jgi:hypothetical protein
LRYLLLSACLLLAACGTTPPNDNTAERSTRRSSPDCSAESYRQYPVTPTSIQANVGYPAPGQLSCSGDANNLDCKTADGQYVPGGADANAGARQRAYDSCTNQGGIAEGIIDFLLGLLFQ